MKRRARHEVVETAGRVEIEEAQRPCPFGLKSPTIVGHCRFEGGGAAGPLNEERLIDPSRNVDPAASDTGPPAKPPLIGIEQNHRLVRRVAVDIDVIVLADMNAAGNQ